MEKFNIEEMNLMCIYNTGSRTGLMKSLKDMRQYLGSDERGAAGTDGPGFGKAGHYDRYRI